MKIWIHFFKEKKRREEKKEKKRCVAQQRVNLTKKEGIFLSLLPNKLILLLFSISRLRELKNVGPLNRIENFRKLVRQ